MKKFLAILLAFAMLAALSVSVLADGETEEPAASAGATHDPVTVKKVYTVNGEKGDVIPSETLTFKVVPDSKNPTPDPNITVAPLDTSKGLDITISFGNYTKMGVYKYTVTENAGETLGVTYDETPIEVIVTVVNEDAGKGTEDNLKVYVGIYKEIKTDEGTETMKVEGSDNLDHEETFSAAFTNDYGVGSLTVSKTVTGNLASNTKEFDIVVTFAGGANVGSPITYTVAGGTAQTAAFDENGKAEVTIKLKHGDSAEFTNIPAGVTYTVVEAEKHTTGDLNSEEGYTATYTKSDDEGKIAAGDKDTVAIQNEKKTEINTGISLDSLPYILIGVAVLAALVVMILRRRRAQED